MIKILVIEDQLHNMRLIEQILEDISVNIELTKACTGEEAVSIGKENGFDLVLMDIALPDMDGVSATNVLKTYPQFKETPFIAVTSYAMLKDEEIFRQVFNDYIPKPIDEAKFIEKINKWLGDKINEGKNISS